MVGMIASINFVTLIFVFVGCLLAAAAVAEEKQND